MHAATLPPPGTPAAASAGGKPSPATDVSGDRLGALINLAGRQRMLSQRIVLQALLAARGQPGAASTAREALALLTVSHAGLVHGSPQLPGAHFPAIREAYFGALQGDARIREFIALTERTLAAIEDRLRGAEALQQQLVASSGPMLDLLNRLTQIYEAEAARHAVVQHQRQQALMADIQTIAKQARIVAFNAQVSAARAGAVGREFAVVADTLTRITGEIESLVSAAVRGTRR
jgi:hypothetical protein